jgi:hypothetical protein
VAFGLSLTFEREKNSDISEGKKQDTASSVTFGFSKHGCQQALPSLKLYTLPSIESRVIF